MALVKKIVNGKTNIEIYNLDLSEDEKKKNLHSIYEVINNIAEAKRKNGKNVDDWFYSERELEQKKKSGKYNFI